MKWTWVILLAGIGWLLSAAPLAHALSCAPPQPVREELAESDVVFKGRAVEIKDRGLTVFRVEQAWKGVDRPVLEIYDTGWDPYAKEADYLVFGSRRDGELRTNLCGRTGLWDADREAAMQKAPVRPVVFQGELLVPPAESERSQPYVWIVAAALLAALLIPLSSFITRRRRTRR